MTKKKWLKFESWKLQFIWPSPPNPTFVLKHKHTQLILLSHLALHVMKAPSPLLLGFAIWPPLSLPLSSTCHVPFNFFKGWPLSHAHFCICHYTQVVFGSIYTISNYNGVKLIKCYSFFVTFLGFIPFTFVLGQTNQLYLLFGMYITFIFSFLFLLISC